MSCDYNRLQFCMQIARLTDPFAECQSSDNFGYTNNMKNAAVFETWHPGTEKSLDIF